MWSNIILNGNRSSQEDDEKSKETCHPPTRYKLSCVLVPTTICNSSNGGSSSGGGGGTTNYDLYLYGGRSGTFPLKDFWRLDLKRGSWEEIKPSSCYNGGGGGGNGGKSSSSSDLWPPHLQEHSMVQYDRKIYVFGGEISFSYGEDLSPLWIFHVDTYTWRRWAVLNEENSEKGSKKQIKSPDLSRQTKTPLGRRGHTAVVWNNYMLIYGGYRDLKGSLGDLWAFHFETESWHLFSSHELNKKSTRPWYLFSAPGSSSATTLPSPRHSHVSVLHNNCLYIHGGMQDLIELQDLWKFDLKTRKWTNIKAKYGPGPLHGHVGVCALESLLIMSGERGGKSVDEFWRFEFASEQWERIVLNGCRPCPRVWAWGGVLPMVYRRVEGDQRRSYGVHGAKRFPGNFDDLEVCSSSTDENNKYWWDYDETVDGSGAEAHNIHVQVHQPEPDAGAAASQAQQQRRKSSIFSELTRFTYNGDYQALSESNSICLSEEEASPRQELRCGGGASAAAKHNAREEDLQLELKGQSAAGLGANLNVIKEQEAGGGNNAADMNGINTPSAPMLIDLGESEEDSGSGNTPHEDSHDEGQYERQEEEMSNPLMTFDTPVAPPKYTTRSTTYSSGNNGVGSRPLSASNSTTTRRSESANCLQLTNNINRTKQTVKKSASVRFADIENTRPNGESGSSQQHQMMLRRECTSDYSSMDHGINHNQNGHSGFENPNYHGSGASSLLFGTTPTNHGPSKGFRGEAIEMGSLKPETQPQSSQKTSTNLSKNGEGPSPGLNVHFAHTTDHPAYYYEISTPNYMLLIGGNESHSSQVVSKKQPLSIWRLRVTNELFSSSGCNNNYPSPGQSGYDSVVSNITGSSNNSSNGGSNGGNGNHHHSINSSNTRAVMKVPLNGPNSTTGF